MNLANELGDGSGRRRPTLAQQLAAQLREELRGLAPGTRLPAETALCTRLAGSLTKVREALTLLAQEGVIERRQGSGTYVADLGRRQPVGLFSNMDLTHPHAGLFYRVLTHELRRFFRDQGLATQLYLGHQVPGGNDPEIDCPTLRRDLERRAISALLTITRPPRSRLFDEELRGSDLPMLTLGSHPGHGASLALPHSARVQAAAAWLADRGCRRLALIGWLTEPVQAADRRNLLAACRQDLPADCVLRDEWVRTDLYPSWPGAGWEEFREVWSARPEKPDGLIVADDNLLPDIATALRELGIVVPGDLRVAALTNAGVSPAVPFPLARVEIDPATVARQAGARMLDILRGAPAAAPAAADFHLTEPTTSRTLPLTVIGGVHP